MGCRTTAVLVWQEVEKMSKFQAGREPKQLTKEKRSPVLSVAVAKKALTDIKEIWIAFQMIGTRTKVIIPIHLPREAYVALALAME